METMWEFNTARFRIVATIEVESGYRYDGDDEDGATQAALDSGEYVAFSTDVRVYCDGAEVGSDNLGGSIYSDPSEFFTSHRDVDPLNRNCTIMQAAHGPVAICHYFPDMVRQAIQAARQTLRHLPKVRATP